ncbi:MAG: P27 family phage terminase small subunit, partial [Planctomycetota bacterium]
SLPSDWFRPADIPLLAAYCAASDLYKQALLMIQAEGIVIGDGDRRKSHPAANILVTQANSMATMAMKLRLCPSARYSEKAANTKASATAGSNRPWETAA